MTKPYGYVRADGEGIFIYGEDTFQKIKDVVEFIPIYTEPPQRTWVDLTDNEVVHLKMLGRDLEFVSMTALRRFARDIAQTLKEKNNG